MSVWHTVWEIGRNASAVIVSTAGPGLVVYFVKDRRRELAATTVAERTIEPDVEMKETGAAEARLVYVQREMDLERQFHQQQLTDRDAVIQRQRSEITYRDQVIEHRDQIIAELRGEIEELQRRLTAVRDRLTELTDTADHTIAEESR